MIRFENVGMRYGSEEEILTDINFELEAGSFHFLTGPSGAGKSSLLKLLSLSHRHSRGRLTCFEKDISEAQRSGLIKLRRRIGIVFQEFRLLDHLTALENVALPLHIMGVKRKEVQSNAEEILEWVGLGHKTSALPPTLSGGEKQRVAIARAVVTKPQLLLADEPTGNVDPDMAERIMKLFVELNKMGTTLLIATHDPQLVARYHVPILKLHEGRLSYGR
ncbi:MAG: cell division ATP-binding protein FtsE [Proteobacteria bacterium]|nr:cell division ATP-binding protein FtsE [Pseudomonadota bacterium]